MYCHLVHSLSQKQKHQTATYYDVIVAEGVGLLREGTPIQAKSASSATQETANQQTKED